MLNPNAVAAVTEVQKRILPAQLHKTDPKNSALFVVWLAESGLIADTQASVNTITDLLYAKINQHYRELVWAVPPAKLKKHLPQKVTTDAQYEAARQQQTKEADAKVTHEKVQADAAESVKNLIDSFNPPHRRGGIDHAVKATVQDAMRAHVAKEKARGVLMSDVLPKLQQFVEEKYTEIQRSIERL